MKKYRAIVSYIDYVMFDVEADTPDEATDVVLHMAEQDELEKAEVDELFEYTGDKLPEGWDPVPFHQKVILDKIS